MEKTNHTDIAAKEETAIAAVASDAFPVVKIQKGQLSAYKQIPLAGLAALGTAFAQLPEGARTIVQSVTKTVATNEPLYVGINAKGISGVLQKIHMVPMVTLCRSIPRVSRSLPEE